MMPAQTTRIKESNTEGREETVIDVLRKDG